MTEHARSSAHPAEDRERGRRAVAVGGAFFVLVYFGHQAGGVSAGELTGDLGAQYHLAKLTAEGLVPIRDFTHPWNVLSWYTSAAMYAAVGGDPSAWLFLWSRVFGPILAGIAVVGVGLRLRWSGTWMLALLGGWFTLSHVVHNKYAIPTLWLLLLLPRAEPGTRPGAEPRPGGGTWALRAVVGGATFLLHVELAVLLGVGVAMYDTFGDTSGRLTDRVRWAIAVPTGIVLAAMLQSGVYVLLGVSVGQLWDQLLPSTANYQGFTFSYPLFSATSLRPKLFPASTVIVFVPYIWRRLAPSTRFVAFLHLAQALIAIRRPDNNHVDAAVTLLGLLVVMTAHDLLTTRERAPVLARGSWRSGLGIVAGASWFAAAMAVGFRFDSIWAIVPLTGFALAAVVLAQRADFAWASAGAVAAASLLIAVVTVSDVTTALAAGDRGSVEAALAAAIRSDVDACTGGGTDAWIVPEPLELYSELGLSNPTPFYLFWYSFSANRPTVQDLLDSEALPAVILVGSWPPTMPGVAADVEAAMQTCAQLAVAETGHEVRILVPRG